MKKTIRINNHRLTRCGLLFLVCSFLSPLAQCEVTLDGSVGPAGSLTGPNYKVTENLGKRAGSNLFHSFGHFNINASESATFSGSAGIKNVISRVTGGQTSNIDGTLRVSIPNANLYLLNPAGVIFGEHAKLDVPGSFHVSTADYLKFQDGVRFDTGTATAPQVLATAAPEAFGFLGENPAGISLSGTTGSVLEVQKGSTISLIGGDITSENTAIYAPGGQINIASVGSAGEVILKESGIQTTSFEQMGNISLIQNPLVPRTTLGTGFILANIDTSEDTAGKIFIRGGQLVMDNSFIASDTTNGNGGNISVGLTGDLSLSAPERTFGGLITGSEIASTTRGEGNAGSISLDVAGFNLTNRTRINNQAFRNTKGNAGNITINTQTIHLQGNDPGGIITEITSVSFGDGDAGNIAITTDSLEMQGESEIESSTFSNGEGGDLIIDANNLEIFNGGQLRNITGPFSTGKGGNLTVDAGNILLSGSKTAITAEAMGSGHGGDLNIISDRLEVNGAEVVSSTAGKGNGGNSFIEADEILLTSDVNAKLNTGISSINKHFETLFINRIKETGHSGNLTVKSKNLVIENGARINTANIGTGSSGKILVESDNILLSRNGGTQTGIINDTFANGEIGELTVNSNNLQILNGAQIRATTFGAVKGGNVNVNSEKIKISGNGIDNSTGITTEAVFDSNGNAGDLTVTGSRLELQGNAEITTLTNSSGHAGKLLVNVDNLIGRGGTITSQTNNRGNAGDLTVNANHITLHDGALITASTDGSGRGGNLIVNVNDLLFNDARLSSTSRFQGAGILQNSDVGKSGDIQIRLGNTLRLENNSSIDVSTDNANAGDIRIKGGKILHLRDSNITTSVADSKGNGGNISLETPIVGLDNSIISARAAEGQGGNINISGFLFQSPSSVVTASSKLGIDGKINLKPDTNISGSIAVLPDTFLNASQQMSERCTARSGNDLSSFVVKGRGGAPLSPGDLAPSNFMDYLPAEANTPQNKESMDHHSLDNNRSSLYSGLGKNLQFASRSIDCTP